MFRSPARSFPARLRLPIQHKHSTRARRAAVNIPVVRSNGTSGSVNVTYTIDGGTATNGSDYTALATGTLTFADGVSSQNIPISIIDDTAIEPNETIHITLSNPTNALHWARETTTTITIHDNDGVAPTGLLLNEINVNPAKR